MTDPILADHAGAGLIHGKPRVNGVEIHYAIGGAGEPVFLLHGVPKTMSYWRHVVPLLTSHYTVIAVDNRGFGPELLLAGRERPFWTYFARRQMWDPSAPTDGDIDEMVRSVERPGGTRAILEMYRARQIDAEQNQPHYANPISCPVLAIGGQAYLGHQVSAQLAQVASDVRSAVIAESGHNIALENPAALAKAYLDFFAGL
jgi:pimeloyl-ACP methyl ester carboxylesterase